MIVVLPLETVERILDHATNPPGVAKGSSRTTGQPASGAQPALAANIIEALNKAKQDKANVVGPLEPNQFNDLSAWCRRLGLTKEGETVEAAVRASG